jgi:septum formation protein
MGLPPQGTRLVLASASPRRLELLRQIGVEPDAVEPSAVEESQQPGEAPRVMAARLARAKAEDVARRHGDAYVLGADTVVACARRVLPKAEDEAAARDCLTLLSGRRHRVIGAIALVAPGGPGGPGGHIGERLVETVVSFKRLEPGEITAYLDSGEWRGKAGGYAIQGRAAAFVRGLNGSYSNVVGLPLFETSALLRGLGYRGAEG